MMQVSSERLWAMLSLGSRQVFNTPNYALGIQLQQQFAVKSSILPLRLLLTVVVTITRHIST